ncbi:MAG: cell wall-binding repeat-containing protein [Coriobacteriia bacterium]|nr:cell wall-binding repeat-containing protein [Coriobacteriia bacterium]
MTIAAVIALVVGAIALSGCISMRPDAVRSRIGVVGHQSGEVIATAQIEDLSGAPAPIPAQWAATPFSVRLDILEGGVGTSPNGVAGLGTRYPSLAPYLKRGVAAGTKALSGSKPAATKIPMGVTYFEVFVPLGAGERLTQLENAAILDSDLPVAAVAASQKALYIMRGDGPSINVATRLGGFTDIRDIEVIGTSCIVADGTKGFLVVDLSSASPKIVKTIDPNPAGGARSVSAADGTLFTADGDAIQVVGSGEASIPVAGVTRIFALKDGPGTLVYAAAGNYLRVFAYDGSSFTPIGAISLGSVARDVCAPDSNGAYVTSDGGVSYVDATEGFGALSVAGWLPTKDKSYGVSCLMGLASVADGRGGARLVQGGVTSLNELATFGGVSEGDRVAISGQFAYVTDRARGLRVYGIEGSTFPVMLGTVRTEVTPTVVAADGLLMLTLGGTSLAAYGSESDGSLTLISTATISPAPVAVATHASLAFAVNPTGLRILDLRTPEATQVGALAIAGTPRSVAVTGTTAWVGTSSRIWAIDVSDPAAPHALSSLAVPAAVNDLRVRDGRLYAACGTAGLRIFDIAGTSRLAALGSIAITGRPALSVDVTGTTAYLATGGSVEAIDVATPGRPRSVAYFRTMSANAVRTNDWGLPVIAGGQQGMFVMSNVRWVRPTALVYNVADGAAYLTSVSPAASMTVDGSNFPDEASKLGQPLVEMLSTTLNGESWSPSTLKKPGSYSVTALARDVTGAEARSTKQFRIMTVERYGDGSRYRTSAAVSASTVTSVGTVVIASGESGYDAVVAVPLAHALGAPLLLTNHGSVPASVAAEITRLGATKAVLVGGTLALRPAVVDELVRAGITHVERLGGRDAADTARLVALRMRRTYGRAPYRVFVTTLSSASYGAAASAVAAYQHAPILYVRSTSVPAVTRSALNTLKPHRTLILGDSHTIRTGLRLPGLVQRLGGATRWDVRRSIFAYSLAGGLSANTLWIAGDGSPSDACAGSVVAARTGSATLQVGTSGLNSRTVSTLSTYRRGVVHLRIAGGAVSPKSEIATLRALGLQTAPPPVDR